jgi:hypothetical protein
MIAELKQSIDLASIVESAGIELRRSGHRHVGLCPFHDERDPSFTVFDGGGWKCFGCGEHGDVIDFVQKIYGLSFKDALKYLGIETGPMTPKVQRDIKKQKRRSELVKQFRKWETRYSGYLGMMKNRTLRLMKGITLEDLDLYAPLLHGLPVWEYHSDILLSGTDEQKFKLFKEVRNDRI